MTPELNTIYTGDCLSIMREWNFPDRRIAIVTDPIWPNAVDIFGCPDPHGLLKAALDEAERFTDRVVIHLGLDSDPRFLTAVPASYKFNRSFGLRLARPHYKGRILYDRDIAYYYGEFPLSLPNRRVIGNGQWGDDTCDSNTQGKPKYHPCPRKLSHVRYLIDRTTDPDQTVLDPFCGSGTTLVAAQELGRNFIGIEINPDYVKIAEQRLTQMQLI